MSSIAPFTHQSVLPSSHPHSHLTTGTDLINGYIANFLLNESCQVILQNYPLGLRQIAAAVPLNVLYAKELSNAVLSISTAGYIDQIHNK